MLISQGLNDRGRWSFYFLIYKQRDGSWPDTYQLSGMTQATTDKRLIQLGTAMAHAIIYLLCCSTLNNFSFLSHFFFVHRPNNLSLPVTTLPCSPFTTFISTSISNHVTLHHLSWSCPYSLFYSLSCTLRRHPHISSLPCLSSPLLPPTHLLYSKTPILASLSYFNLSKLSIKQSSFLQYPHPVEGDSFLSCKLLNDLTSVMEYL